jgi:hypothetical protein
MVLGENHNGAIPDKWKDKWLGLQDLDFKKICLLHCNSW